MIRRCFSNSEILESLVSFDTSISFLVSRVFNHVDENHGDLEWNVNRCESIRVLFFPFWWYGRIIALRKISILHTPFFASNLRLSDNCNYRCLDMHSNLLIMGKFISLISCVIIYRMNVNS